MSGATLFWLLLPITALAWLGVILAGELVWAEVLKPWWAKRKGPYDALGPLRIAGLFLAAAFGAGLGMVLLGVGYRYFTGIWPCVP